MTRVAMRRDATGRVGRVVACGLRVEAMPRRVRADAMARRVGGLARVLACCVACRCLRGERGDCEPGWRVAGVVVLAVAVSGRRAGDGIPWGGSDAVVAGTG